MPPLLNTSEMGTLQLLAYPPPPPHNRSLLVSRLLGCIVCTLTTNVVHMRKLRLQPIKPLGPGQHISGCQTYSNEVPSLLRG